MRILRRKSVQEKTGLSRSSLYALEAAGNFPKSIQLGPRAIGFLESEIDKWIAERVAASRRGKVAS